MIFSGLGPRVSVTPGRSRPGVRASRAHAAGGVGWWRAVEHFMATGGPLVADHRPPDTELAQRAQADGEPKSASLREVNSVSRVMMKRAICSEVCCAVSRSCRTSSVENWLR